MRGKCRFRCGIEVPGATTPSGSPGIPGRPYGGSDLGPEVCIPGASIDAFHDLAAEPGARFERAWPSESRATGASDKIIATAVKARAPVYGPGAMAAVWPPAIAMMPRVSGKTMPTEVMRWPMVIMALAKIGVAIVRMAVVIRVVQIQVMRRPADRIGGGDSPEETGVKMVTGRVRVVIDRVGPWIIVIHRVGLINDDLLRFVIRNVNHFRVDRRDFDRAVSAADDLVFICLQVAGQ